MMKIYQCCCNNMMIPYFFSFIILCLIWKTTEGQEFHHFGLVPKVVVVHQSETITEVIEKTQPKPNNPNNNNYNNNNNNVLEHIKNNKNLRLTSLLQDDLSYLENDGTDMEKEHQTEILERILYGHGGVGGSQHRYLEDDDFDDDMSLPTCIAPPSSSSSSSSSSGTSDTGTTEDDSINTTNGTTNSNTTTSNTTTTPTTINITGIVLLQMIGRPTVVSDNETELIGNALLVVYQNLSTCEQAGIIRQVDQIEIIPDLFGINFNESSTSNVEEQEDTNNTTEMNRYRRSLFWNEKQQNMMETSLLWKTPDEYFEWNRHYYYLSLSSSLSSRFLQEDPPPTVNNNNNTNTNNNTMNTDGDNSNNTANTANSIIPVTQPMAWLARLSGTCNGCALQSSLFDDVSSGGVQRHRLLFHQNHHLDIETLPQIRGGGSGGGGSRSLFLEENTKMVDDDEEEICNCPGPSSDVFYLAMNDTIQQLIQEGLLTSIDSIEKSTELIRQSLTCSGGGGGKEEVEPVMETFFISINVTVKACPEQFDEKDRNETVSSSYVIISPLQALALAYQKSYNELNLLSGGQNCDPYVRRLTNVTAMILPEFIPIDAKKCTNETRPLISIRLDVEAECIGCNATLFDLEEDEDEQEEDEQEEDDPEESDGTRWLRKLQQPAAIQRNSDLFPFCFCPEGTPSKGITTSELFPVFNDTLTIFEREGRGGIDFDVELVEVKFVVEEVSTNPPTFTPTTSPSISITDSPTPLPTTDSPTIIPTDAPSSPPTTSPTPTPTFPPSHSPSHDPSGQPSSTPTTASPTGLPTPPPTGTPTTSPTGAPTPSPTGTPTESPTGSPTPSPTSSPTASPTGSPTSSPTGTPTVSPTENPTVSPSGNPTPSPTGTPSAAPTENICSTNNPCGSNAVCSLVMDGSFLVDSRVFVISPHVSWSVTVEGTTVTCSCEDRFINYGNGCVDPCTQDCGNNADCTIQDPNGGPTPTPTSDSWAVSYPPFFDVICTCQSGFVNINNQYCSDPCLTQICANENPSVNAICTFPVPENVIDPTIEWYGSSQTGDTTTTVLCTCPSNYLLESEGLFRNCYSDPCVGVSCLAGEASCTGGVCICTNTNPGNNGVFIGDGQDWCKELPPGKTSCSDLSSLTCDEIKRSAGCDSTNSKTDCYDDFLHGGRCCQVTGACTATFECFTAFP